MTRLLLPRIATFLILGIGCLSQAHAGLSFKVIKEWGSGRVAEVLIENTTDVSVDDWTLTFSYDQPISRVWNGSLVSQQDGEVVIEAANYNSSIAPGSSVSVGMTIRSNDAGTPDNLLINGENLAGSSPDMPAEPDVPAEPDTPAEPDMPGEPDAPAEPDVPSEPDTPAEPDVPAEPDAPAEPDVPAEPDAPAEPDVPAEPDTPTEPSTPSTGNPLAVSKNGKLGILGADLVNQSGTPIQLTGMSSHGLQWFGEYMNESSIEWMRDDWNANVVRAAMYTAPDAQGYISDPSLIDKVYEVVDAAIELDMYVIVDWHILSDNDPNTYRSEAIDFFDQVSTRYSGVPNVIYEIANEPNGDVNWEDDIKPYAEAVIPAIRSNDPDSVVLVGTGTWSQDVRDAADDPLDFGNVAYAFHFYACTHGQSLRDGVSYAVNQGAAVFSTEWGTADASGGGSVCPAETRTWIDFFNDLNISWVNWSVADKEEATAALNPGANTDGNWTDAEISTSGKLVRELLRER